MTAPLVSVVVPCLNAAPMLRATLESVLAQTHPALEIIFVDNGSTDGSPEIAHEVLSPQARPFRIVACPERGVSHARNFGLRFAAGAYVQWLDADDLLDADKIALQVAALEASRVGEIAYSDFTVRFLGGGPRRPDERRILRQEKDQISRVLTGVWYPPHSYLLRRSAADRILWNPACRFGEDLEYSGEAALTGLGFLHVPRSNVVYNLWSAQQESRRLVALERIRALEGVFARLTSIAQALPRGALADRHRMLLGQDWRIWRLPRGSMALSKLDGRRVRLQQAQSGRQLDVRPREAELAKALLASERADCSYNLIDVMVGQTAPVVERIFALELLQKLARTGFLVDVTESFEAEAPAPAPSAARP